MGETPADITGNDDAISLREWIAKHSDHLDEGIHELLRRSDMLEARFDVLVNRIAEMAIMIDAMHAELEAAKPLIERWQHSKIRKLADGIRAGSWPASTT